MRPLLGIDYGGTRTKLLLAREDEQGLTEVRRETFATPEGAGALEELGTAIRIFLAGEPVSAFALTIAGILDQSTGQVVRSANMPWLDGLTPATEIARRIGGMPGTAVQDGAAAAIAEAQLGAGRGHDDVFVVILGTGIAGAHIVSGRVRAGAHHSAGEIGHVGTGTGRWCSCGQRGCLETFIGGRQLTAQWVEATGASGIPSPTARDVIDAADHGEPHAVRLLDTATTALGHSLLGIAAVVDPGLIVLGGGLAQARESVVDTTVAKARSGATFHRLPPILPAALGPWAGAWGAVLAARDDRSRRPAQLSGDCRAEWRLPG